LELSNASVIAFSVYDLTGDVGKKVVFVVAREGIEFGVGAENAVVYVLRDGGYVVGPIDMITPAAVFLSKK